MPDPTPTPTCRSVCERLVASHDWADITKAARLALAQPDDDLRAQLDAAKREREDIRTRLEVVSKDRDKLKIQVDGQLRIQDMTKERGVLLAQIDTLNAVQRELLAQLSEARDVLSKVRQALGYYNIPTDSLVACVEALVKKQQPHLSGIESRLSKLESAVFDKEEQ